VKGPKIALVGRALAGVLLCVGSVLDWWTWLGGPTALVTPGSVRGYEAWSGRAGLVAGVGLLLHAALQVRTGRRHASVAALLAAVAVLAVLAGPIEMPESVPRLITYRLETGYWVSVAGAALAALASALEMRRPRA
jgi:hypothetical protein